MKKISPLKMRRVKMISILSLLIAASLMPGACSSRQPDNNHNAAPDSKMPEAAQKTSTVPAASDFNVTGAWRLKKVVIKTRPTGDGIYYKSPGMNFTIGPEAGLGLIAVELTLKKQRRSDPISADVVLVDSSGDRHKALHSFPSAQCSYKPGGSSLSFDNDTSQVDKSLSERGGKLISVFSVPLDRSGFKVEIDGSNPINIEMKPK